MKKRKNRKKMKKNNGSKRNEAQYNKVRCANHLLDLFAHKASSESRDVALQSPLVLDVSICLADLPITCGT